MEEKIILVVEDNKDDEELIKRAFKKNKIETTIVVVRDGEEALNWLFAEDKNSSASSMNLPDLIIMDLKLPKIGGLDVLKQIKGSESTRLIPTVVLTTSNEEADIKESFSRNANSYIRKPVDFNQFIDVVKDLSNYWLNINQNIPVSK